MFATYAGMSMTPRKVTPTTASPLAPSSKTCPPTGCAPSARLTKHILKNNNQLKSINIMLNKKVSDLLNEQINKELYSAYLYLDMNNYFDKRGLSGFANWYMIQAQEERDHAMLIYKYMQNNDCPIKLNAIAMPDKVFKTDMDVLKAGLEHEEYVTASIHTIYDAAYKVKDFRTMQFLDWFVKEQGEEETNARDMITKMELFGSDPKSLYMLNQELAARTYSAPSLVLD